MGMEGRALTVIYESLRSVRLGHTPASPLGFASLFSINPAGLVGSGGVAKAPPLGSLGSKWSPGITKDWRVLAIQMFGPCSKSLSLGVQGCDLHVQQKAMRDRCPQI